MRVFTISGQGYKLPDHLTTFQQDMYVHLIDWKWAHITGQAGTAGGIEYDAIIPDEIADQLPVVYPGVRSAIRHHATRFPFRLHKYFNHMASSQAANINLFLPVLQHPEASAILGNLRPDFAALATSYLDNGFRIEFWDEPFGNLRDKSSMAGTDADIAIAYYNRAGRLRLWLIEHKLTEKEFTECGGSTSKGRKATHDCGKRFADLLRDPAPCYYHDACKYNYWPLTRRHEDFFPNHDTYAECPFRGGMNQLWRNQLLALSVQDDSRQPFEHVSFSVVKHPANHQLDATLTAYKHLTANNPDFSVFTSADVLAAASKSGDGALSDWIGWYKGLYNL